MRLTVKESGREFSKFRFAKGPVYLGRAPHSQVLLPGGNVSRQHAVIYNTKDRRWIVEDLGSANKTYLNDKEIHKAPLSSGDLIRTVPERG